MKPYSGRMYEDGEGDGPADWMDAWTIFYWGWWIAFSPFVGMFIAKISRGRTIRQFINGMLKQVHNIIETELIIKKPVFYASKQPSQFKVHRT